MFPYYFIPILLMFFVLYLAMRQKKLAIIKKIIENRNSEKKTEMVELAKKFIDKDCLIYSFDGGHQYEGVIKEVTDGAILIEKDGKVEAINLEFVMRIREYPKNKKGKKKSLVLD